MSTKEHKKKHHKSKKHRKKHKKKKRRKEDAKKDVEAPKQAPRRNQSSTLRIVKASRIRIPPVLISSAMNPSRIAYEYREETRAAGQEKNMSSHLKLTNSLLKSSVWVDDAKATKHLFDHLGVYSSGEDFGDGEDDYVPILVTQWEPDLEFAAAPHKGEAIQPVKSVWDSKVVMKLIHQSAMHLKALKEIDNADPSGHGVRVALHNLANDVEAKFGSREAFPTMALLKRHGLVVHSDRGEAGIVDLPFTDVRCLLKTCYFVAAQLNIGVPLEVHSVVPSKRGTKRKPHVAGMSGGHDSLSYGSVAKGPPPLFDVPGGDSYSKRLIRLEDFIIPGLTDSHALKYTVNLMEQLKDQALLDPKFRVPCDYGEIQRESAKYQPKFIDVYKLGGDGVISFEALASSITALLDDYKDNRDGKAVFADYIPLLPIPVCTAREVDSLLDEALKEVAELKDTSPAEKKLAIPGVTVINEIVPKAMEKIQDNYYNGSTKICAYNHPNELVSDTRMATRGGIKFLEYGAGSFAFANEETRAKFISIPSGAQKKWPHVKPYNKAQGWMTQITNLLISMKLFDGLEPPNHVSFVFMPAEVRRVPDMLGTVAAASKPISVGTGRPALVAGVTQKQDPSKNYSLLFTEFSSIAIQFSKKLIAGGDAIPYTDRHWEKIDVGPWSAVLLQGDALEYWDHVVCSNRLKSKKPGEPLTVENYDNASNKLLIYRCF